MSLFVTLNVGLKLSTLYIKGNHGSHAMQKMTSSIQEPPTINEGLELAHTHDPIGCQSLSREMHKVFNMTNSRASSENVARGHVSID